MDSIKITPAKLNGIIYAPSSKSMSHRAIICASLCNEGESIIKNIILSEDIKATIDGMKQLGAEIEIIKGKTISLSIKGNNRNISKAYINCRESGSTLRFLIPIGLMLSDECVFNGSGKLVERPLDVYYNIFEQDNIYYETNNGKLPLTVRGNLQGGCYEVTGSISSQFITGLFFALPLLNKDSTIIIKDKLESKGYIDLTLEILKKFNIFIENIDYKKFKIKGNSEYKSTNYNVEGDYSQGAFFLVAKEIGNNVECLGLEKNSLQGDKEIADIIRRYHEASEEIIIDASQIPDLVPILAVLASLKDGITTKIINAERVRIKESDRLKAISTELKALGADIEELSDGLLIKGKKSLKGNVTVKSWNDHRIAMSLAIAATRCDGHIILQDYKAVNKSYPEFWTDYKSLGGKIDEFNVWK
ncbi:MAG: 3-phosphoshikimate 1-carboxyvinyltransferase [Sedimentibacter sp.]|uniref:3-phosphoshikimate 1-carboxyvinyltransferase n=1 Tax=Sedimentibacter sp. TaxID=1960295 RepID=UPI002981C0A5|nr:3-phosphoshikimate 1-carboxyvinyltransferase [Sedimentibacter sp.]MDW5299716.1 3-phosphoshikimate 1-carboxyvinyltransferase [Sedimentibacter sp.]